MSNLTAYEAFQLARYGNILRDSQSDEIENKAADIEAQAERINNHYELELINP